MSLLDSTDYNKPSDGGNVLQMNGYDVVHPHEHVWHIKNVFSTEECDELIQWSENVGYDPYFQLNPEAPEFRKNSRLSDVHMPLVAERLTEACKPMVPAMDEYGRTAESVLERMRYSRYPPGGRFAAHFDDGFFINEGPKKGQWSIHAVIIYLNDGYEGGSTKFLKCKEIPEEFSVYGGKGDVLIFRQRGILHQGSTVTSGTKYILASSFMYSPFPKDMVGVAPSPAVFKYAKEIKKINNSFEKKNLAPKSKEERRRYNERIASFLRISENQREKIRNVNADTVKAGHRINYSPEEFLVE